MIEIAHGTAGKLIQDQNDSSKIIKITKRPTIESEIYEAIKKEDLRFSAFKVLKTVETYGTVRGMRLKMDKLQGRLINLVFSSESE